MPPRLEPLESPPGRRARGTPSLPAPRVPAATARGQRAGTPRAADRAARARGLAAGALLALAAGAAGGEPLAWRGSFRLEFLSLPSVEIPGVGVATVDTSWGGIRLRELRLAGGIAGETLVPVTDPEVVAFSGISHVKGEVELGTGTLAPFWPPASLFQPQLTRNTLPVGGVARLCFFFAPDCWLDWPLALSAESGATGVGVGGLATLGGYSPIRVSVEFAPWTVGTAFLSVETPAGGSLLVADHGWVHGPASFTQSTALPDGALSLVTPLQVVSRDGRYFQGFGRLTLRFVPEPGLLLLLGTGVLGLATLGRHRRAS